MAITLPSRRTPTNAHVCDLSKVNISGKVVDLTNEAICRQLQLPEGTTFICETTVERDGKQEPCGKQHRLHYPRDFRWQAVRAAQSKDDANSN